MKYIVTNYSDRILFARLCTKGIIRSIKEGQIIHWLKRKGQRLIYKKKPQSGCAHRVNREAGYAWVCTT
jgi:predicted transcriptional regulator